MNNILRMCLCITICLTFASGILLGQGSVGTLNGTILDSTGALIPDATVTARNTETGVENKTSTTSAGAYTLPYLASGTYDIRVSSPGFRTTTQEGVTLRVGQVMTVNISLELGAVSEEVTVSAAAPLLESGTAEMGRYITADEYVNWPILVGDGQRQIQDFIFSSLPGTTGGTFEGSINGGQQYSHEILIEGIPLGRSDLSGGNNNEMSPSAEAVGEFKLQTGAMGAQYNGGQTAVANFGIKGGTNELHGSAFYYGQNEAFDANSYSNTSQGVTKKSPKRQHNYGYSVGGPVYIPKVYDGRNRTFFFTNLERNELSSFNISGLDTTLPVGDFRAGNFARLLDPNFTGNPLSGTAVTNDAGQSALYGQIFDPRSTAVDNNGNVVRDPFPGNQIPTSMFSDVYNNVMGVGLENPDFDRMIDNKNTIGGCCPFQNLYIIGIKGDHNINDSHRVSGYYNHEYRIRNNSPGGRYLPVPGSPTGVFQDQYTPSRIVRLSLNSTISPTILNRLAGGYNRFRNTNESVFVDQGWAEQVGVRNTSPSHFPRMNFNGTESQGGTIMQIGSSSAGGSFNGSWFLQDDVTIIKGAHTFRVGYEYRRYWYNERNKNGSGNFNFNPRQTGLPGFNDETGHAYASFVLGAVDSASRGVSTLYSGFRHPSHGVYFMDDWKVTPKLTINLGLRWEIIQPFFEVTDRMSMMDMNAPNPAAGGRNGALIFSNGSKFQDTNWMQLGPRFGLAYRVNDKMVIRAGYGITNTPQTRNDWGFGGFTTGYSGDIPIISGTASTGFADDPAHWLDDPYPDFAGSLPDTDPGQGLYSSRQTTAPDSNRLAYVQNWNATIQYQLPKDTVVEAAYVGNKGTRLWSGNSGALNGLPTSFLALGNALRDQTSAHPEALPFDGFDTSQSLAQALRPFPQYGNINEAFPYGVSSSYHSLQVTATRHFAGGLSFLAAYTFSKALGYSRMGRGGEGWQDPFNRGLEKSVMAYSIPQQLRLSWIYELPFGQGKRFDVSRALDYVVGGWTLSGIHSYQAGSPIGIGQDGLSVPAGFGSFRPDVTGSSQKLGGAPDNLDFFNGTPYLDPNGFAESPRTDEGVPIRVGTAPKYLPNVRGPHGMSESFRITKTFSFAERVDFEFGAAMTNPFNRHGRGFVSTNVSSTNFGMLKVNGGGQRVIQLEGRFTF